jgi:hypothetical protein
MSTECAKCKLDSTTHSFSHITKWATYHVYYTSFARLKDYNNSETILAHIRGALAPLRGEPWLWVIDSDAFAIKHAMSLPALMNIAKFMRDNYANQLAGMYILNSGTLLQGTITHIMPLFDSTFQRKLTYLNGSALQLLPELEKIGWGSSEKMVLVATVAAHRSGGGR